MQIAPSAINIISKSQSENHHFQIMASNTSHFWSRIADGQKIRANKSLIERRAFAISFMLNRQVELPGVEVSAKLPTGK